MDIVNKLFNSNSDEERIKLINNIYDTYHNALTHKTANILNDLLFVNNSGVYSSGQMLYTDAMEQTDVGANIYNLVYDKIKADAATYEPKAIHYSGKNQWILFIKDHLYVLTHSTTSKLNAWARWTLPANCIMRDMCSFRDHLFGLMETPAGTFVYSFNPSQYEDELSSGVTNASIPLQLQSSFNSLGYPGNWKKIYGILQSMREFWVKKSPKMQNWNLAMN